MLKLGMGVFAAAAACVLAASGGSAFAAVTGVTTESGIQADGQIDWGLLGGPNENATITEPFTIATGLTGISAEVSEPGTTNFTRRDQVDPASGKWYGNFGPGEKLLWTTLGNNGPITIVFSSAVRGVGSQIQSNEFVDFDATIDAYDSSDTLIGSLTRRGTSNANANDSAIFIGLLSDTTNIMKVVFSVNALDRTDDSFAINGPRIQGTGTTTTTAVPLPPAALMGLGVLGAGALKRLRRRNKTA